MLLCERGQTNRRRRSRRRARNRFCADARCIFVRKITRPSLRRRGFKTPRRLYLGRFIGFRDYDVCVCVCLLSACTHVRRHVFPDVVFITRGTLRERERES